MASIYFALVTLKDRLSTDREKGATAVEYGLLVGLIAVVIIVAVTALGGELKGLFESVNNALPGGATTTTTTT